MHTFSAENGLDVYITYNGDFSGDAMVRDADGFVATVPCDLLLKFGLMVWRDKIESILADGIDKLWSSKPEARE